METVGFIGLGVMDAPMASHLQAAGHRGLLYRRKQPPASLPRSWTTLAVCDSVGRRCVNLADD